MFGQAVHGIGFTPMFTLGTAYVDDNSKSESTAVYLGLSPFYSICNISFEMVVGNGENTVKSAIYCI
jgi:hypothetical protein